MVAVTLAGLAVPADASAVSVDAGPVQERRVVAVAVSPMELLRPGSDLLRMIDEAGRVDLLVACEDGPVAEPSPVGVLDRNARDTATVDLDLSLDDDDDDDPDGSDDLRAAVGRLGRDELHLHRLALRAPLGAAAEPDLVAALSELVGFDPEPGVRVLAPAPLPGDAQHGVVERAVGHIVQVYGLPLQRYRCLELAVVDS